MRIRYTKHRGLLSEVENVNPVFDRKPWQIGWVKESVFYKLNDWEEIPPSLRLVNVGAECTVKLEELDSQDGAWRITHGGFDITSWSRFAKNYTITQTEGYVIPKDNLDSLKSIQAKGSFSESLVDWLAPYKQHVFLIQKKEPPS